VTETTTAASVDPNTGAGLIEFLDAAIEKGWFNVGSAKALKIVTLKIFEAESGWESMDLRSLDADSFFDRFRNLKRNAYSDGSMRTYGVRFRQALKMHLARLDGDPNWKSYGPSPRTTGLAKPGANGAKNGHKTSVAGPNLATPPTASTKEVEDDDLPVDRTSPPGAVPLMRFPFPLRDTVDVWLTLPRDLTREEADRLAIFIRSLARADGPPSSEETTEG
jgi:hypothetical protein